MAIVLKRHDKQIDRDVGVSVFSALVRGDRLPESLTDLDRERVSAAIAETETFERLKVLYEAYDEGERSNARLIVGNVRSALVKERDLRNRAAKWRLELVAPASIAALFSVPALIFAGVPVLPAAIVGTAAAILTAYFGYTGLNHRNLEQIRSQQVEQCTELKVLLDNKP